MTLRTSLQRLIGRDPARLTLRERAAETAARLAASKPASDAPTAGPSPEAVAPQPDPVLSVIEEGRRLLSASREAFKLPDVGFDPHPDRETALHAAWGHFRGPLSSTVPTTARGCAELARYAGEFREFQGVDLGDEMLPILANIARSPIAEAGAQDGRRAEPTSVAPTQATYGIAGRVDFAAVTLKELRTIHEESAHLSATAYAMASQGCCRSEDRSPFGNPHNAAGELMHWIGDALTDVESAAADELTRRQPTGMDDRALRLAAIAERIIFNGDDAETAAFVRDLAVFAAEQAGR